MEIINAMPSIGAMTNAEGDGFLESKLNVQLATIDETGDPNIQPLWFYYDRNVNEAHVMTNKMSKYRIFAANLPCTSRLMTRTFLTRASRVRGR